MEFILSIHAGKGCIDAVSPSVTYILDSVDVLSSNILMQLVYYQILYLLMLTCPKTPYKQRLCKMCGEALEDQTHFLLMCPKLRESRVQLFNSVTEKYPTFMSDPTPKKLSVLLHPQEHIYCIIMGIYNLYTCRQKQIFNQ